MNSIFTLKPDALRQVHQERQLTTQSRASVRPRSVLLGVSFQNVADVPEHVEHWAEEAGLVELVQIPGMSYRIPERAGEPMQQIRPF